MTEDETKLEKINQVKVIKVIDIFGKLKNWKKSTKQIMKEIDKDLDG